MKYFQHHSDSRQHPKWKRIYKVFGALGYYIGFCTFEIISQYGGKTLKLSFKKYNMSEISEDLKVSVEDMTGVWEEMMEMRLLSRKEYNKGYLYSKKLCEYQDEYMKKVQRISRQGSDTARPISANKRREENIRKENILPESSLSSFYKNGDYKKNEDTLIRKLSVDMTND
jgi:hypothetical protein